MKSLPRGLDLRKALGHLEQAAASLHLQVRYERFDPAVSDGGLCRLGDRWQIIVDADAPDRRKVQTLAGALRDAEKEGIDLDAVYLPPLVRRLLA